MGIFTDLNQKLGRNDYPPTQEIQNRWEAVQYYAGLRDGKEEWVRNEAIRRGLGGRLKETYLTQPLAFAISQASSNLLFGEKPNIKAGAEEDQARLEEIINTNRLYAQCRAAAITSSSEGGVYLKLSVDPTTQRGRKAPLLQFISELRVMPRFIANELVAATIITIWEENKQTVRLFENHEPGYITYELWKGTSTSLGVRVGLDTNNQTADLEDEVDTGVDELLVSYIPNSLRTDNPYGISDYANGVDDLLLAFNDATTIAHRATQAGVPMTILPRELLDENQNLTHEKTIIAVNKLADTLGEGDIGKMIETVQHNAQQDQFMNYAKEILDLLLIFTGINPQSLGRNVDGGATSGTALKLKMSSTLSTAAGKASFFEDSLGEMLRLAAIMDTETVGEQGRLKEAQQWTDPEALPSVKLHDGLPDDEREVADIIQKLKAAGAISLRESVKRANPHATEQQIQAEIEEIENEKAVEVEQIATTLPTITAANLNTDLNS